MKARIGLVAAALIVAATHAWAACREDVVWLRGDWGETSFRVELATTVAQRSRGLMFRDSMADDVGCCFSISGLRRSASGCATPISHST